jgi:pimeloyl-ACP methyl ester carboxylesterase
MKKLLKYIAATVVILAVGGYATLWAWGNSRRADATPAALSALTSDDRTVVAHDRYLTFRPAAHASRLGVIFYPGANCDIRGYAPLLRRLAESGYLVVDVPMPLEFAFLAPDRALEVMDAYPEVQRWAMMGHSLGGAMAASFVHRHPERIAGLVLWDSYPPEGRSLAEYPRPVWHIHRATADGMPPPVFEAHRRYFPANAHWTPIRGGIHMYFGSFDGGGFQEDWAPTISREDQQEQVVAATLEALRAIES